MVSETGVRGRVGICLRGDVRGQHVMLVPEEEDWWTLYCEPPFERFDYGSALHSFDNYFQGSALVSELSDLWGVLWLSGEWESIVEQMVFGIRDEKLAEGSRRFWPHLGSPDFVLRQDSGELEFKELLPGTRADGSKVKALGATGRLYCNSLDGELSLRTCGSVLSQLNTLALVGPGISDLEVIRQATNLKTLYAWTSSEGIDVEVPSTLESFSGRWGTPWSQVGVAPSVSRVSIELADAAWARAAKSQKIEELCLIAPVFNELPTGVWSSTLKSLTIVTPGAFSLSNLASFTSLRYLDVNAGGEVSGIDALDESKFSYLSMRSNR